MYVIDEEKEELAIQAKYEELIVACRKVFTLSPDTEKDIFRAFTLANKSHRGIRRKSGEPYIFHPLAVALIAVQEVGLGPIAVICALLHDVVEDTDVTLEEIRTLFGDRVATIVDGVTKIEDFMLLQPSESKQAENYRKILLSMCNDAYVIFLKLCDRLHNMRTLDAMRDTKQLAISAETQYLYIPLAHRLGLYSIKTELEDLVMKYTNPEKYNEISNLLGMTSETADRLKRSFTPDIERILKANKFKYTIKTRVKSVYSCWKKMERKGVTIDQIYDLYAMRIIIEASPEQEDELCFKAYNLIAKKYTPKPDRVRDWITNPKSNGYKSIQITVMTPEKCWVEIQIRSTRMDDIAEKGMAAHFLYKEAHPEEDIESNPVEEWLQQLRTTLENTEKSALDLVKEFTETLYTNEIFLFTPKGEKITLPAHSSVLDFAFAIHSKLGLHCIGAKVNGRVEPYNYKLRAGDQVQVLTSQKTEPSEEWLDYVQTQRAKDAIRDSLREQHKQFREEGQQRLIEMLKEHHINLSVSLLGQLRSFFKLTTDTDLYFQVAKEIISEEDLLEALGRKRYSKTQHNLYFLGPYKNLFDWDFNVVDSSTNDTEESGEQRSILLDKEYEHYEIVPAPCCNPVQDDNVVGIVDNGKIMVHRTNCKNAMDEMAVHENRIVRARWRKGEKIALLSGIAFSALDRQGLLQKITHIISEEMSLNMRAITLEAIEGVVHGVIMLYVLNLDNLNQLIEKLSQLEEVEQVRRI